MSKMDELVKLIYRARSGDSDAFATIVERFQDMAYGYAYAFLNDFSQAEDASQEAFIEAYHSLPSLREARAFPAWFKRIVFKHCDRLTRVRRRLILPLETSESLASPNPGPDEIAERNEVRTRVRQAIGELPLNQRIATTLFYIDGYSHHEIADFLEVPAQTVKSRLHASRKRLKERMLDMVQEELNANALPEGFTRQTVEEAVTRARALNNDQQFTQAEQLLRQALTQAPGNPAVLKELNRALMRGKVYGEGRWDLLPELAQQGQVILQTSEDEEVYRQLAHTLLAIPAMQEAISFLENWISKKGPNPERVGMLAWAKGCVADYESAEHLWQEFLELARELEPGERVNTIRFVCYTLVDCLAEAGEQGFASQKDRAQRVADGGWEACRAMVGALREGISTVDWKPILDGWAWLRLLRQAGLDYREAGELLLAQVAGKPDPESQGTGLSIRAYLDDPEAVVKDWLVWARERIAQKEWKLIENFRFAVTISLRQMGRWEQQNRLAQGTWEMLGVIEDPEVQKVRRPWGWERFNYFLPLEQGEWVEAEKIARQAIQEGSLEDGSWGLLMVAAVRGEPTPRDLVEAVEKNGIQAVDTYGLAGWYLIAREAAAAGNTAKAFEALRKSLAYWSNPPYGYDQYWENDAYWGELRKHPEFKRIFAEKRERIGPVYGELHYFPGW